MISASRRNEFVIDEEARDRFARLLPELQQQVAFRFRYMTPELREERTAAAVALAFEMFVRLIRRNKTEQAFPTPLAEYACRQAMSGRQCGTPLNIHDITSHHCQRNKGIRGQSIHHRDRDTGCWQELVVEDRQASPADVAATRIDFRAWLATLSNRQRQIAEALACGESTQEVARQFQLTGGRISQLRCELRDTWNEFQGQFVPAVV
jgi:hypothetical protein